MHKNARAFSIFFAAIRLCYNRSESSKGASSMKRTKRRRLRPLRFLIFLLLTFFLAPFGWVSVVLMFICCVCLFGIGSPEQFLIVKHAKGGEMLGGCCIQGAFNLGNAMGAFLGGIPVAMGLGYNFPALIGVPMALAGAICLLIFHKKYE